MSNKAAELMETAPQKPVPNASLKVVHLCATDSGGAGRAAYRLHKGMREIGLDSVMLVAKGITGDPTVKVLPYAYSGEPIPCPPSPDNGNAYWQMVLHHWAELLEHHPNRPAGLEIFTDDFSGVKLECIREIREADIINLHWTSGLLDPINALYALRGKKIVWTMHDMNPFTGGCHYAGECDRYTSRCTMCPQLGPNGRCDTAAEIWQRKLYAYRNLDISPVTPSRWLGECVNRSPMFADRPARVIANGVATDIFRPHSKESVRSRFGVPAGSAVVMFGAGNLLNERKGFSYLLSALQQLAGSGRKDVILAHFGSFPKGLDLEIDVPVLNLGTVGDERELAMLYSLADLFVIPSLEDNLPNTVVEAMACGVPVAGFENGGIPDMVEHQRTGFLVTPRDVRGLVEGMTWCLENGDRLNLGRNCREKALSHYDLLRQAGVYEDCFRDLLSGSEASDETIRDRGRTGHPGRTAPPAVPSAGPAGASHEMKTGTGERSMNIPFSGVARLIAFLEKRGEDTYPEIPSGIHSEITRQQLEILLEKHAVPTTARILDVGCGQGPALDLLSQRGFHPVGITINDEDIAACLNKGHEVVKMDQSFLDFADASFDIVWARHVIEHSIFPYFTLFEFHRVLAEGGLLYLEMPAPDTSCHHETNKNHYSVFSISMWGSLLNRTGFTILEHIKMNFTTGCGPDEYWSFVARKTT